MPQWFFTTIIIHQWTQFRWWMNWTWSIHCRCVSVYESMIDHHGVLTFQLIELPMDRRDSCTLHIQSLFLEVLIGFTLVLIGFTLDIHDPTCPFAKKYSSKSLSRLFVHIADDRSDFEKLLQNFNRVFIAIFEFSKWKYNNMSTNPTQLNPRLELMHGVIFLKISQELLEGSEIHKTNELIPTLRMIVTSS